MEFVGGVEISLADCTVSESAGFPEELVGKVYTYNLKDNGIDGYDKLYCTGHSQYYMWYAWPDEIPSSPPSAPEVFYNDETTTLAKYPNGDEYARVGKVIKQGITGGSSYFESGEIDYPLSEADGFSFAVDYGEEKLQKLKNEKDAWLFGYWRYDWSDQTTPIEDIDIENKVIESQWPSVFGVLEGQRYYIFNALCELDSPGEWYYDRETGDFYIYPPDNNKDSKILMAFSSDTLFYLKDCEYINFRELNFKGTRTGAMGIENCSNINVFGTIIKNVSGTGITASGNNITIDSCHIYNTGARGITITGGDTNTLEKSNNLVTNNWVHNFGRLYKTYYGAITVTGVGNTVRYNKFNTGPHLAVQMGGNDNLYEYNEISDCLKEAADSGAMYTGRSMTNRGNVIRGNIIHDIVSDSDHSGQYAIYLDDCQSGYTAEQNLIYNVPTGIFINGGRDNNVTDNVFASVNEAVLYQATGLAASWGYTIASLPTYNIKEGGIHTTEPYKKYPHLADILEDDMPTAPKYNVIKDNINYNVNTPVNISTLSNTGSGATEALMRKWSEVDEGITADEEFFSDTSKENYNVVKDLSESLPGFDKVNFNKAGLITSRLKNKLSSGAIAMAIGKPMAYVNWKRRVIDENNISVVPEITDNLTYVPVRFLAEMLDAEVSFEEGVATINYNSKVLKLKSGENTAVLNDSDYELGGSTYIKNDRMYIPLRSCSELFEKEVFWDDEGLIIVSDKDMTDVFDKDEISNLINRMA